jgi:hypothetical protein
MLICAGDEAYEEGADQSKALSEAQVRREGLKRLRALSGDGPEQVNACAVC